MNAPDFPHAYLFKEVSARTAAKKAREGICKHWGCSNTPDPGRRVCNTCRARMARVKNPTRYAFNNLKDSARKRAIPFLLTFEQFVEFDRQTGYVESRGKGTDDLTVDRIDSSKPYEVGNIRALTWIQNCSKKVEKMTDPVEPIARAIAEAKGEEIWQRYIRQAGEVLGMVECLQAQMEGGFEPPIDEEDEEIPF